MLTRRSFVAPCHGNARPCRRHACPRRGTRDLSKRRSRPRRHRPVACFEDGTPVRGDAVHGADWMGARWTFATAANREAFLAAPERFAPAFGGYCAFAASRGYLAPTIPGGLGHP